MTTGLAKRNGSIPTRKSQIPQQRSGSKVARQQCLPAYLEPKEVEALLAQAPHAQARLLMLVQWRAGLRISEALGLEIPDLSFDQDNPTVRVKRGKGNKARFVPMHLELAAAFRSYLDYAPSKRGRIFNICRSTGWRWTNEALARAILLNQISPGRPVHPHTLRHSAARHWLASGVPINHVSRWLGHASIQTTLIYLEILPDPTGFMDRVP
jgi:integrase/recombinase XerC